MNRVGHYLEAEALVDTAVQGVIAARERAGNNVITLDLREPDFWLRAAHLHFELALIPTEVERAAAFEMSLMAARVERAATPERVDPQSGELCVHGYVKGYCPDGDPDRPGHACVFGPRPGPPHHPQERS